jgi:hypothetical protein
MSVVTAIESGKSLLYCGQPAACFHLSGGSVCSMPWTRSLWFTAAGPPLWMQNVSPSGFSAIIRLATSAPICGGQQLLAGREPGSLASSVEAPE